MNATTNTKASKDPISGVLNIQCFNSIKYGKKSPPRMNDATDDEEVVVVVVMVIVMMNAMNDN